MKDFAEIPNVEAIKVAAFNRYQTLDVICAVAGSSRTEEIALYTGNDDHIIGDLLTTFHFRVNGEWIEKQFAGGLLGHWVVWTSKAVALLEEIKTARKQHNIPADLLTKSAEITDSNAVT